MRRKRKNKKEFRKADPKSMRLGHLRMSEVAFRVLRVLAGAFWISENSKTA